MQQASDWSVPEPWVHGMMTEKRNAMRVVARVIFNSRLSFSWHVYDACGKAINGRCADLEDGMRRADELLSLV